MTRQHLELASRQGQRYEAAVRNGYLGGRPRRPRTIGGQLTLPGFDLLLASADASAASDAPQATLSATSAEAAQQGRQQLAAP